MWQGSERFLLSAEDLHEPTFQDAEDTHCPDGAAALVLSMVAVGKRLGVF